MGVLAGNNAAPLSYQLGGAANDLQLTYAGYLAVAGTMATAFLRVGAEYSGANAKVVVYNSAGSVVDVAVMSPLTFNDINSAALTGVLSAATYYLGVVGDGYLELGEVTATSYETEITANSYSSPSSITVNDGEASYSMSEIGVWVEDAGSTGVPAKLVGGNLINNGLINGGLVR